MKKGMNWIKVTFKLSVDLQSLFPQKCSHGHWMLKLCLMMTGRLIPVWHLMNWHPCTCFDVSDCPWRQHSLYGDSEQRRLPAELRCDWPELRGGGGLFSPPLLASLLALLSSAASPLLSSHPRGQSDAETIGRRAGGGCRMLGATSTVTRSHGGFSQDTAIRRFSRLTWP